MASSVQSFCLQSLLSLIILAHAALAADPTPVTTSLVVVSTSPTPVTFTASRVSDASKYASLTAPTTITTGASPSTVFKDGFLWVLATAMANPPPVPTQFVPTTGVGSTIIITATTGTPPPTVTFTAAQDTALSGLTTSTTSSGTVVFPLGWFWFPVAAAGGAALPEILPVIPPGTIPPEATAEPTPDQPATQPVTGCATTRTATATAWVWYSTDADGEFRASTTTNSPSAQETACVATTTVVTSTIKPDPRPTDDVYDGFEDEFPEPEDYEPVSESIRQYLNQKYLSLGIIKAIPKLQSTRTCSDNTYDKAIPSAAAFISGLSPNFCADWKADSALSKGYTAKDAKAKAARDITSLRRKTWLKKRTPPPAPLTQDAYPGWEVDFQWTPKKVQDSCTTPDYCNSALKSMLAGCNGYSLADAYKGGSIDDDCGTFSYSIKGYPTTTTTCAQQQKDVFTNAIHRDDAIDAIGHFCEAHDGTVFKKGSPDIVEQLFTVSYAQDCAGTGSFTMTTADCIKWMTQAVDHCDTKSIVYKHGGTVVDQKSCAAMTVHPVGSDQLFYCLADGQQMNGFKATGIPDNLAKDVVSRFCDRNPDDPRVYTLEPEHTFITGELTSGDKPWYPFVNYRYHKDGTLEADRSVKTDYSINMKAFWRPDNAKDGLNCPPKKQYKIHGNRCHDQMNKLLGIESGQCGQTKNAGGSFTEISPYGCVQWSIYAGSGGI